MLHVRWCRAVRASGRNHRRQIEHGLFRGIGHRNHLLVVLCPLELYRPFGLPADSVVTSREHRPVSSRERRSTDAEAAFRICKSDLSIRPIWHQKAERVKAHIFVCFLAYVLWKTLEKWQSQAGLGNSPRTLLDELRHIQSVDVILNTVTNPPRELTIRCVVRPDRSQAILLDRLGIRLPQRLRQTPLVAKM